LHLGHFNHKSPGISKRFLGCGADVLFLLNQSNIDIVFDSG